jgi:hypothetical protein
LKTTRNTATDTLEKYLAAHCQDWKEMIAFPPAVGDWLWNPSVAFAQVKELRDEGKAIIHVRTRCNDALVVLEVLRKPSTDRYSRPEDSSTAFDVL